MGEVAAFLVSESEIVAAWEKVKCREHGSGKRVKVNKFTYKSNFIRSPLKSELTRDDLPTPV